MKRSSFVIVIVFLSMLVCGVQAQTRETQKKEKATTTKHEHQEKTAPQATPHEQSGKEKAFMAKKLLEEAKEDLVYDCCLEDACDRCALDEQSCQCGRDLRAGKGVCSDCYAGWQMGHGKDIPGMTRDKVKLSLHSHNH